MTALTVVIIALAAALVAWIYCFYMWIFLQKIRYGKTNWFANDEARRIINEAIKTATRKRKKRFSRLRNSYIRRGPNRSAR